MWTVGIIAFGIVCFVLGYKSGFSSANLTYKVTLSPKPDKECPPGVIVLREQLRVRGVTWLGDESPNHIRIVADLIRKKDDAA